MAPVARLATRTVQLLVSAVVLALSITINTFWTDVQALCDISAGCDSNASGFDVLHSVFQFGAFAGAFGIVDALIGFTAALVAGMSWIVPIVAGSLAGIFLVVGGCRLAVLLAVSDVCAADDLGPVCHRTEADTAFMFAGCLACLVAVVQVLVQRRSETKSRTGV